MPLFRAEIQCIYLFIQKKVEPYWCEKVGKSRIIGDFNVKTESLKTSADYDIRVVTVNKGVTIAFTMCVLCVCIMAYHKYIVSDTGLF